MITKFISSAGAIVTLDVYLQSQLHSNDPLFLFASNSLLINSLMLLLAAIGLFVSFQKSFNNWYAYAACSAAAVILGFIGVAGGFFSSVAYTFSNILLPLNYMLILQSAVVLGICSLSFKHAPAPARVKRLPANLKNTFAGLRPRLWRPTTPAHGGRMRPA